MLKKITLAVAAVMAVTTMGVSAERNPYNEMDCINLYNKTIEEYAVDAGITVEEFKTIYGLPDDMPANTNEAIALEYIPLKCLAGIYGVSVDEIISSYAESYNGTEVLTGDTLIMEVENNLKLSDAIGDIELEEFKKLFGFDDSVTGDTPYKEVDNRIKRVELAGSDILSYDDGTSILVMLKGKYIDFDVAPVIENNSVLVPMRNIFTALGAQVSWQNDVQTVLAVREGDTIAMQVGQNVLFKNNERIEIPTASIAKDGRVLVPIRAVAEALNTEVYYNSSTRTVVIH